MHTATIFNIQRYSLNDGPGIRTTVFFKGCPLTCWWCHNPESQSPQIQLLKRMDLCINCGRCKTICSSPDQCLNCGACATACPTEALTMVGKEYTIDQIYNIINKDRLFYEESGGGVTFSGGEPLLQHQFLIEILKKCQQNGLHATVDTSGFASTDILREVDKHTDLWLYDIKHMNSDEHKLLTGVPNELILENLKVLASKGSNIKVRFPIIPTCNDDIANIKAVGSFIASIPALNNINILPYHKLAADKHRRFAKDYKLLAVEEPTPTDMAEIKTILELYGLKVTIGG